MIDGARGRSIRWRTWSAGLWTVADEGLSSLTNFLLLFMVLRNVDLRSVGGFGIAYSLYFILQAVVRAFTTDPLLVRYSGRSTPDWRDGSQRALGLGLALAVPTGALIAGVGLLVPRVVGSSLIALGLVLPGVLCQDAVRFACFADRRPQGAFGSDLICFALVAAGYGWAIDTGRASAFLLIGLWGLAGAVAAAVTLLYYRLQPAVRSAGTWLTEHRDLGPAFAGDYLAQRLFSQAALTLIGAAGGLSALGAISASRSLFAPITTVQSGINSIAIPEGVRLRRRASAVALRTYSAIFAAGMALLFVLFGLILSLLSPSFGAHLLGRNWAPARSVLAPMTAFTATVAAVGGFWVLLRVLERARETLVIRVVFGGIAVVAAVLGAKAGGANGGVWALAGATAAQCLAMGLVALRAAGRDGQSLSESPPAISDVQIDVIRYAKLSAPEATRPARPLYPMGAQRRRAATRRDIPSASAKSPERLGGMGFALVAVIGIFEIYWSSSIETLPLSRPLFGLVVLTAIGLILARGRDLRMPVRAQAVTLVMTFAIGGWTAMTLTQPVFFVGYAFGDLAALALPVILLVAMIAEPRLLDNRKVLVALGGCFVVAAIVAHLFGRVGPRSAPPDPLLIVLAWYLVIAPSVRKYRVLGIALVALVFVLTASSGYRTHLILCVLAAPLLFLALRGMRQAITVCLVLATVGISLALVGFRVNLASDLQGTRFNTFVSGQQDASLSARFLEADDVIATARDQWFPGQALFGSGPGASYVPNRSPILQNVNPQGTIHNIHIGPIMVLFRYGLIGLIGLAALVLLMIKTLARTRQMPAGSDLQRNFAIFGTAGILFLTDFMVRNASVQPSMAFTIAGCLVLWSRGDARAVSRSSMIAPGVRPTVSHSITSRPL